MIADLFSPLFTASHLDQHELAKSQPVAKSETLTSHTSGKGIKPAAVKRVEINSPQGGADNSQGG